jgi:hypothetical protein
MHTDDPLRTLTYALEDARQRRNALALGGAHQHVVMFPQCWTADQIGADDAHASCTELHSVIVMDADSGASVYFGTRLAYHVTTPNRRFFLDVAAQCMAPRHECGRYEGLDDDEVQSLDYGLEMNLCRWHAQIKCASPSQCQLVARLLHAYADRFARCTPAPDVGPTSTPARLSHVP